MDLQNKYVGKLVIEKAEQTPSPPIVLCLSCYMCDKANAQENFKWVVPLSRKKIMLKFPSPARYSQKIPLKFV